MAGAVADYNKEHYIELPVFQKGMLDLLDRKVTILDRIKAVPATGNPTRYWEQTKLPSNAKFVAPRLSASATYGAGAGEYDYGRVERSAWLKCITSEITFTLFDTELVKQQGIMEDLLDKDMKDMVIDILKTQNKGIWVGKATAVDNAESPEYCGLLTQIKDKVAMTLSTGKESVLDAIRTKIAKNEADTTYDAYPTALYANPVTIDLISQIEAKRENFNVNQDSHKVDLGNGFIVQTVPTMAGNLPLIPDKHIPLDTTTSHGNTIHTIVAVNEDLLERHYLTSDKPRVFKLGKSKTLADDYVAVQFDTVIAKGADAKAHFQLNLTVANA